jgi:hypothetical protein
VGIKSFIYHQKGIYVQIVGEKWKEWNNVFWILCKTK